MAERLSARQLSALRYLIGASVKTDKRNIVDLEHIEAVDQRPVGGLGRRELIKRETEKRFVISAAALEAVQQYESMDVFRQIQRSKIASVFERTPHFKIANIRTRRSRAA